MNTTIDPIVIPASDFWGGNDGRWSTFDIYVGTPPQRLNVLVSIVDSVTFVSLDNSTDSGCPAGSRHECAQIRGGLMNVNASSTWSEYGTFQLQFMSGDVVEVDCGYDDLGLELQGDLGISLRSQPIAASGIEPNFFGLLGVNPVPENISLFRPQTSFLSSLRQSNSVPSLSFAYSAGAQYRQNSTASLILGGYDASRFAPTSGASFRMEAQSGNFVVDLQTIIINNAANKTLLPHSISPCIDPTVPEIWLPHDSCSRFEDAFDIIYEPTTERYLVNDTLHSKLQSENASISFLLRADETEGPTINVTLPYASFDLEIGPPIVNTTQRYFPLRRAESPAQYILGRTFLQEAYLIADFERSNFSLYQNAWTPNALPQIVSIAAVPTTTGTNVAGVAIGAIFLFIIGIGLALDFLRKKRAMGRLMKPADDGGVEAAGLFHAKPELDGTGKLCGEVGASISPAEADAITPTEMQGDRVEPSSSGRHLSELEGSRGWAELRGTLGGFEKGEGKEMSELKCDKAPGLGSRRDKELRTNSHLPSQE